MAIGKWSGVINASQGSPAAGDGEVTALQNGGYVVIWKANNLTYVRVFDGLGNAKPLQTIASTTGAPRDAKVTTLDDGSFVVTWSGNESAVQLQKFSITGVPDSAGIVTVAGPKVDTKNIFPSVASDGNEWVVVWKNQDTKSEDGRLWFSRQNGASFSIAASSSGATKPVVTELGNGQHVVAWEESGIIKYVIVRADNTVSGATEVSKGSKGSPSVTALSNGNFAISWHDFNDRKFSTKVYDTNGVEKNSLAQQGTYVEYPPQIVALTKGGFDGGYAVIHMDWKKDEGGDPFDIYLRLVKADGTTTVSTLITDGTTNRQSQKFPSITELADGRISITWENTSVSPSSIQNQIIDAREMAVTVEGSRYDDIYVGTNIVGQRDVLYGRVGNDTLYGGAGDDFLFGGVGADSLEGGAGFDWASYDLAAMGVTANLQDSNQNDKVSEAAGDKYNNIEALEGSRHNDKLTGIHGGTQLSGLAGVDTLIGGNGADRIYGGDNNDLLYGGAGGDTLDGGFDDLDETKNEFKAVANAGDTVSYQNAAARVDAYLKPGDAGKNTGDARGDTYNSIENLIGSEYSDVLAGNDSYNWLAGNSGNDLFYGLGGNDLIWGQAGDDTLEGGAGADTLDGDVGFNYASYAGAGTATKTGVTVDLIDANQNTGDAFGDQYIGNTIQGLIGSAYSDKLYGTDLSNILMGGGGADNLYGRGGFDYASYANASAPVTVVLPTGGTGNAGEDTFDSIEGLIGSNFGDTLIGNASANELRGMGGDDALTGGAGADTLNGGSGIDTVVYSGSTTAVTINLATSRGSGGDADGDIYSEIENVIGSQFGDTFIGNGAANVFYGGKGDDIYYVSAGDVVVEYAEEGNNKVFTDGNYTLGGHIQDLEGTGGAALALTGNVHNNTITGNAAGNWIDGGAGADTMRGGGGDDIYVIDNAGDVIIDYEGNNSVVSTVQLNLSNLQGNFANITVAEGFNFNVEGTSGHNVLKGNASANTLKGNGGNDKLYGMLGNDKLYGGTGRDTFVFDTRLNKNTNVDKIYDFKSRDDSFHLDNAIFTKLGSGTAARPKMFKSDMFVEGTRAKDREDRIVYDKKTGALYYDQDGTGSKAQVKIATITNKTKLYYHDFYVI